MIFKKPLRLGYDTFSFPLFFLPDRYVGTEVIEDDDEAFEEKMKKLTNELGEQLIELDNLEKEIKKNMKRLGHEIK